MGHGGGNSGTRRGRGGFRREELRKGTEHGGGAACQTPAGSTPVVVAVGAGVATSGGAEQVDALGPIHFHQAAHDLGDQCAVARRRLRGPEFLAHGLSIADAASVPKGSVRPIWGMFGIGDWVRAAGGYLRSPVSAAGRARAGRHRHRLTWGQVRQVSRYSFRCERRPRTLGTRVRQASSSVPWRRSLTRLWRQREEHSRLRP